VELRKSDSALLAALGDECQALQFATAVFVQLLRADKLYPMPTAAALYSGRGAKRIDMAVVDYPPIIVAAAAMLGQPLLSEEPPEEHPEGLPE
jgi:hypothetical protein